MKLTSFDTWVHERAVTLATNARGRYAQAFRAKDEVGRVTAQIEVELRAAYRRGRRAVLPLEIAVAVVMILAALGGLLARLAW